MGDKLVPEEISKLLGAVPTSAYAKGHQLRSGATSRSGIWSLSARVTEPEDLDRQVSELLAQVTPDLSVWGEITARFRVDLFCGWFMGSGNEGVTISPQTMVALGLRGVMLSLDIYGYEPLDEYHDVSHT